jgi:hypothetical protein
MRAEQLNRVSSVGLVVLSLTALLIVLGGATVALFSGSNPFHEPDEGTAAHIFQLSILALVPLGLLFFATGDWSQPLRSARRLAFPAAAVVLAFGVLYYFDHYS